MTQLNSECYEIRANNAIFKQLAQIVVKYKRKWDNT